MDKTLLVSAKADGVDALLCLNGMVLSKLPAGQEVTVSIHEFIQSGENRIQVISLVTALRECSVLVCIELHKYRGSDVLVQPQILYTFQENFANGEPREKNRLIDVCVALPVSFPKWRYFDVLQAANHEQNLSSIQDFILDFLRLVQEKKLNALLPYFSVRNREIAMAYGLDPQQVHHDFQSLLQRICMHATFADTLWDPESWCVLPVRKTAVYALLNRQHQPLFQFHLGDDHTTIQIPMHVGVLGGEVFVLR